MPTSCQSDTCQGNGECRKSGGVVKCICGEGWSGYTCGERQCGDMCVPGTCDKGTGLCTCQQGYLGDDCSQSVTKVKVSAPVDMWVIILICVLGVLVLVVGGLLFGCRKRCPATLPSVDGKVSPHTISWPLIGSRCQGVCFCVAMCVTWSGGVRTCSLLNLKQFFHDFRKFSRFFTFFVLIKFFIIFSNFFHIFRLFKKIFTFFVLIQFFYNFSNFFRLFQKFALQKRHFFDQIFDDFGPEVPSPAF